MKKDVRKLIERAEAKGWRYAGLNGSDHHELIWPTTGEVCTVPSTPNRISLRHTELWLEKVAGVPLRDKPGPGRSKDQRRADADREKLRASKHHQPRVTLVEAPPTTDWRDRLQGWATEHGIEEA